LLRGQLTPQQQRLLASSPKLEINAKQLEASAPKLSDFLNNESKARFSSLKKGLENLNIEFIHNDGLVRGLDYYSETIFEFIDKHNQGRQSSVLGGGRYDSLIQLMSGPNLPAIGFAAGIDRIMLLRNSQSIPLPDLYTPRFIAVCVIRNKNDDFIQSESSLFALKLAEDLRKKGHFVYYFYDRYLANQIDKANRLKVQTCVIVGENEIKENSVSVKNLQTRIQQKIQISSLHNYLISLKT